MQTYTVFTQFHPHSGLQRVTTLKAGSPMKALELAKRKGHIAPIVGPTPPSELKK